jgi:hypothetical protein
VPERRYKAEELFCAGSQRMKEGKYVEARRIFESLTQSFPDNRLAAPAYWAIGMTYYDEGGRDNLYIALDQLKVFTIFFDDGGRDDSYLALDQFANYAIFAKGIRHTELLQAAQLNIPIIKLKLMGYGAGQNWVSGYLTEAKRAFEAFLERWPDSQYAPAVKDEIDEIDAMLTRAR